jgi:hypothetical protein
MFNETAARGPTARLTLQPMDVVKLPGAVFKTLYLLQNIKMGPIS